MPKPAARVTDLTQHGGVIMPPCAMKTMIEMLPAARLTDLHVCPMVTVLVPHVGGPIVMAAPTVFIEFLPAARVMDQLVCVGPPDMIQMGAMKTFIGEGGGGGGGAMGTISPPGAPAPVTAPAALGSLPMPGVPAASPGVPADGGPGAPADKATTEGDPIDVATGRMFTRVDDFTTQGKPALTFTRFYSTSMASADGAFGYGWTHSLDQRLHFGADFITYQDAQGRHVLFLPLAPDQEFIQHLDENITLRRLEGRYRMEFPDGRRLHFQEAAQGTVARLERIDAALGGTCHLHYQNGLLGRLTDVLGNEYLFESADGKRIQAIIFRSRDRTLVQSVARFTYDAVGNLVHSTDAMGYSLRYQYDADHRLLMRTDACEHTFQFEFDHQGRCVRSSGPDRLFDQTFYFHQTAPQTAVRDVRGRVTTYAYNALGMVTQVVNAEGGQESFEYQGLNLVKHVDPLGRASKYAYDTRGNLLRSQRPGGATSTMQVFRDGSRQSEDAEGNVLVVRLDSGQKDSGQKESGQKESGQWRLHWAGDEAPLVTITSGPGPRRLSVQDARGHATVLTYDSADRLVGLRQPLEQTYEFVYDARGQRIAVVDPAGAHVKFVRDALGRITTILCEEGRSCHFDYDGAGNLSHYVDGNGRAVRFEHRQYERLTGVTDPAGCSVRYEYDDFNRLRRCIDGRGGATVYDYDALGRVQRVLYPEGRSELWTFDAGGQLRRWLDRGGMGVDCDYDSQGNQVLMRYLDGTTLTFAHDRNGRLLAANNADGAAMFTYDKLGRLCEESQNGASVAYTFDASGLLVAMALPDDTPVTYDYDANGRLIAVRYGEGRPHTFAYSPSGPMREHHFPNGVVARAEHTGSGLPDRVTLGVARTGRSLAQTTYRYDGNDALLEVNDSQLGTARYRYDPAGRIVAAQYGSATGEAFQYDPAGNLIRHTGPNASSGSDGPPTSHTLTYNTANQLEGGAGVRFQHDARGQVIQIDEGLFPQFRTFRFGYNGQGLLTAAILPDGSRVEYAYDALARRISKKMAGGIETYFAWAGHQLVGETTFGPEARETRRTYLYRPGTYFPLAVIIEGVTYCIHTDHRDAPVRVTDPNGETVWLAAYSVWGSARLRVEQIELNLRMPGHYYDAETGLHYNRTRCYHPRWGRYLTPDPAGYGSDLNLYAYAGNDPVNRIDPMGLWPHIGGGARTVGGAVADAAHKLATTQGGVPPALPPTATSTPTVATTTPVQSTLLNAVAPMNSAPLPTAPAGTARCGAPSGADNVAGAVDAAAAAAATGAVLGAQSGGAPACPAPAPPGEPGQAL